MEKKQGWNPNAEITRGNPPRNDHAVWKKGQSGNPKGRPRGSKSAKAIINELLNNPLNEYVQKWFRGAVGYPKGHEDYDMNWRLVMLAVQLDKALKGDVRAAIWFFRISGEFSKSSSKRNRG